MGVHRHTITVQETRKQHKMAGSRVPMTLRDSFFNDSFFKSTWDDFEKVRENMFKESKEMWKNFEDEFKKMEGSMSHNMLQNSSQMMESSGSSNQMMESSDSSNHMLESGPGQARGDGWMVPRKWMLPSMANTDFAKQLDLFQTKDSEVIRVKDEPDKFEVSLDASQYRPDELSVNVADGVVSIEGKHEEKSEDGRKMVSRQFSRKYTLPQGAKAENVVSN